MAVAAAADEESPLVDPPDSLPSTFSADPFPTPPPRSPSSVPTSAPSRAWITRSRRMDSSMQDWSSRGWNHKYQYNFMKWSLCFLLGLFASLVGFFNNLSIENIAAILFVSTSNMMLANKYGQAFGVFAASNFVLTLFSLVTPAAAGSGIPEVKAYLNGVDALGIFSLPTLLVKIVGSICAVSSSLHVGKAGPLVHTGACIAAVLGQGGSKRHGLTCRWLRHFKNDRDRRDLVTCGSAAGIAAAFRAPVGGVLFCT